MREKLQKRDPYIAMLIRTTLATSKERLLLLIVHSRPPTDKSTLKGEKMTSLGDPKWKEAAAHIGEIVLLSTALDYQLNSVVVEIMHLEHSPMLEPVIATIDARLKIEMIKARAKKLSAEDWKKGLLRYVERIEDVNRMRNIACHVALIPVASSDDFEFRPAAVSKVLKSMTIDGTEYSLERVTLRQICEAVDKAESALGDGVNILENFAKLRAAKQILTMSGDKST